MKKENKMPTSVDFSGGERGKFLGKFKSAKPQSKDYQPRTELGRKLITARRRIVASGEKLLSRAEVSREVKERRGGSIDE
jgi:hypothetical protein